MAKFLCDRCVGGTTGILESEIVDPCGNCRRDAEECPCNGIGKRDACGVCNGGGTSCLRVSKFHPRALLVNTKAMRFSVRSLDSEQASPVGLPHCYHTKPWKTLQYDMIEVTMIPPVALPQRRKHIVV
ncbi:uncharacterized protein TNCV_2771941 [Trichonephila clavipes]|nr:uncharacterized protein TNCV_2771941 [Trichonephila clavipes]